MFKVCRVGIAHHHSTSKAGWPVSIWGKDESQEDQRQRVVRPDPNGTVGDAHPTQSQEKSLKASFMHNILCR
jgi:hypothetical protein